MTEMSPLRRRMIDDMTVRNLSPATQRSYVHAVAKFARFFGRSPEKLDLEDVRAFQVHLVAGGMSWPALNQTVCALGFLYGVTLRQADLPERIAYAREPQKLPVVLSAEEVVRFLEAVPSLKCRAALTTAYAAGLRASEVASLKAGNWVKLLCRDEACQEVVVPSGGLPQRSQERTHFCSPELTQRVRIGLWSVGETSRYSGLL